MFCDTDTATLASMSETKWSDLAVSGLPTGTVTLLLADVEGSTRLWETQPDQMTAAIAMLDGTLADLLTLYNGVRPVEQGEGDSFVLAFARASDAVTCALALQRAPLAPVRLRIGLNTGEIQLRDEGNYIGPTINRTARLRDLAHGGQTVLSGATESMVIDHLPADTWLTDLGTHALRDLPRPERVVQLCHPDIRNEFPPLRTSDVVGAQRLPSPLTSFVGRVEQIEEVRRLLADNRLVTLTGAGGVGKTRLAVRVAAGLDDEVWYVDLAPLADADVVPVAVIRALGLPDQPGRPALDTLLRFVDERRALIVLDNCEHLLDACADLIVAVLDASAGVTLLTTSREPIGIPGEVTWRVPSLSPEKEAADLFADRARLVRPDFSLTDDNAGSVIEICRRLDGVPLAVELAAARVRALSLAEILDSLHDRFRLLTGGSRTAVRRQQTLRASVDWSHALLTEPERVLFRRLAVFMGGFDLDAAQPVAGGGDVESYQVLDLLTLLVDKSLVVAEARRGRMRYRLLETVRQYAQEKLGESGEADDVRSRHRDYYTAWAALLDAPNLAGREAMIDQAEIEIDNLRGAFAWSREQSDGNRALQLASALHPMWFARGRIQEGVAWFDAVVTDEVAERLDLEPVVVARAFADKAMLTAWVGAPDSAAHAERAVAAARELEDASLLGRALTARSFVGAWNADLVGRELVQAIDISRTANDPFAMAQNLAGQAYAAMIAGDPRAARQAAEDGRDIADSIGDGFLSRTCRIWLAYSKMVCGDLAGATAENRAVLADSEAARDLMWRAGSLTGQAQVLAYTGEAEAARVMAEAAVQGSGQIGELYEGFAQFAAAIAALAAGDPAAAKDYGQTATQLLAGQSAELVAALRLGDAALALGDVDAARGYVDQAVSATHGWHNIVAMTTRARISLVDGEPDRAERDAHDALACAVGFGMELAIPDILECLGAAAAEVSSYHEATRLLGAAHAIRQRIRAVRFKIHDATYEALVATIRNGLDENDFDAAWTEGAALSTQDAVAYAQRGRGERKRPPSGWASLTPTELDVVRLVSEGLGNKDIAARLFVSHRTVQTHLTHVYTKLGLTSRLQLAQEASRRA
jgi:predicted ATPase/class 3 adenylate cyclase/DNA-binding CsgD family transcriptional regulator